jgi:uncharacterized protein
MDTPAPSLTSNDRLWSVLCHLSWFVGFPFFFPLVVYLVMKQDSPFVAYHAKEALNFHLSLLLYALCSLPFLLILLGVPILIAIVAGGLVLSIIAAVKTSENRLYRYPMTIRFIS